MKRIYLIFSLIALACTFAFHTQAQTLQLPQPSPDASVMQKVGVTEIKITYSAPGVKGRKIWGELLPYDSLWRAGANAPTKISFSTEVEIAGKKIEAGEYTLIAIPKQGKEWTFILNTDSGGNGVFTYKKEDDVLRFPVAVEMLDESKERLAYYINPDQDEEGTVTLRWEKAKASFKVGTSPMPGLKASVNSFMGQWFSVANAAEYMVKNDGDLKVATKLTETSIAMAGENLYNVWVKAQVMAAQGDLKEATSLAQKAKEMGEKSTGGFQNFYNNTVKAPLEASLEKWSN